ncbi:MAG: glycosyltransferase family 4 protein [Dolichospermum sp. DET50]|jgi:glycosyltransferase involved in cell wall biosynthesis|nr:glycosyltransferase family 4 protein [Dolichospermum sp. DET66]MBS3032372.1 glycosyltransferase family 4 protein [Dolichospermum sp. DET67]MBS3037577.1 glycosyltransferase family 4 protein [Dolichospermum sp. DET50]QSX69537.1 MAG: glycosyltransferase family 4 protein [Dolichospermum sp. DET69]
MNIVVALEYRFDRTPDGIVWTQTQFPYSFWQRYLEVFDHVQVVARVRDLPTVPSDWKEANGDHVSFAAIPYYIGPVQYLQQSLQVKRAAQQAVRTEDAVILRVSSTIASCIEPKLRAAHHPYAVEVVADPYDVFAPGSIRHPLRPFFRWWYPQTLRRQCARACAAAYVTKQALQTRYPCPNYSVGISDVDISEKFLVLTPRQFHKMSPLNLIFVGTLAQLYKAPNILLSAMAICVQEGINLKLTIIGDGKHRTELETQAAVLGLKERVCFRGQLGAGKAVITELDQADLFILPSYQEGLPRAMVEAMARALPCIGSTVGGIPELIPPEDMVPPGDVAALAAKIREVVTNPERMAQMSARNLEKAKEYKDEMLRDQRIAFYRYVRGQTEAWLLTQKH